MRKILFFLLSVLILAGCHNNKSEKDSYTIATLKGPSSMGMIRMIDSLSKTSDNIKFEVFTEPMQVRKMMLEGTADFAVLPSTMAAILYNNDIKYRLVAVPCWGSLYLIGNDTDTVIKTWQDLKNERIYVMAKSMTPDLLFRYLLTQNGLNPEEDVVLDYSFPTHINLANAIGAGKAQYGVMTEPYVSVIMQNNSSVRKILNLSSEWNKVQGTPLAETAFLCKEDVICNNPELVEKVISMYSESTEWVNTNPEEAAGLMAKYEIIRDSVAALNAIPNSNLKVMRARDIRESINNYFKVFYNMNPETIGEKIPDENFIY